MAGVPRPMRASIRSVMTKYSRHCVEIVASSVCSSGVRSLAASRSISANPSAREALSPATLVSSARTAPAAPSTTALA